MHLLAAYPRPAALAIAIGVLALTAFPHARATNGYFAHGYGTRNKAMAGAGAALALDAMAPATNPAAVAYLESRLDGGIAAFIPPRVFRSDQPSEDSAALPQGSFESKNDLFLIPHFGLNYRVDERQAVALTLAANGGINAEYDGPVFEAFGPEPPNEFAVTGQTLLDLSQIVIGLTYATKIGAHHAVGLTPILALQRARFEGLQPFAALSVEPDKVTDNGYAYSYGAGARFGWQSRFLDDRLMFGASYQTRVWMSRFDKYEGLLADRGDFDIPPNYSFGVALNPMPKLTLALDIQRILYDDISALGNDNDFVLRPGAVGGSDGIGFGWRDITVGKLGLSYDFTEALTLYLGYSKVEDTIRKDQLIPNIIAPAILQEHFTAGFTQALGKKSDLSFSFLYAPKKRKSGTNPNTGLQTTTLNHEQFEAEINWGMRF
jgi:long-chain fatty acid transport protein